MNCHELPCNSKFKFQNPKIECNETCHPGQNLDKPRHPGMSARVRVKRELHWIVSEAGLCQRNPGFVQVLRLCQLRFGFGRPSREKLLQEGGEIMIENELKRSQLTLHLLHDIHFSH